MDNFGYNSRMDNIQATVLNFRLNRLKSIISKRRNNANYYRLNLNKKFVYCPPEKKGEFNTYHTFVIQVKNRDRLKDYLLKNNIKTYIHYKVPIHLQAPLKKLKLNIKDLAKTIDQSKKILSIPVHHNLSIKQKRYVVKMINNFFK